MIGEVVVAVEGVQESLIVKACVKVEVCGVWFMGVVGGGVLRFVILIIWL